MSTIHDLRQDRECYWSQSRINLALTCLLKYAYTYVYRLEPEHTPSALIFGTAIHSCLSIMALHQKDGHPLNAKESEDLFATIWQRSLMDSGKIRFKNEESSESLLEKGQRMIGVFHKNMPSAEEEECLSVAEALAVPIVDSYGNALPVPLICEMDILVRRRHDGQKIVRDWKTAARKKSGNGEADIQPTALLYAFRQQYGEIPEFEYHLVTKAAEPGFQVIKTTRALSGFDRLIGTIIAIDRAVKAESFFPATGCFACSDCQYESMCSKYNANQAKLISIPKKVAA